EIETDDAVDLSRGARRDEVPHRDACVGEGHAGGGEAGAPRARVGLEDLDEDVDSCARALFLEDDGTERLRKALRNLDGPPIGPGSLSVGDAEGRHVVPALDEGAGRILEVSRMRFARTVYRREDLVPAPLDVGRAVRPPQHARLAANRS